MPAGGPCPSAAPTSRGNLTLTPSRSTHRCDGQQPRPGFLPSSHPSRLHTSCLAGFWLSLSCWPGVPNLLFVQHHSQPPSPPQQPVLPPAVHVQRCRQEHGYRHLMPEGYGVSGVLCLSVLPFASLPQASAGWSLTYAPRAPGPSTSRVLITKAIFCARTRNWQVPRRRWQGRTRRGCGFLPCLQGTS